MKEREDKNDPGRASRVPPGMCKFRRAESHYSPLGPRVNQHGPIHWMPPYDSVVDEPQP